MGCASRCITKTPRWAARRSWISKWNWEWRPRRMNWFNRREWPPWCVFDAQVSFDRNPKRWDSHRHSLEVYFLSRTVFFLQGIVSSRDIAISWYSIISSFVLITLLWYHPILITMHKFYSTNSLNRQLLVSIRRSRHSKMNPKRFFNRPYKFEILFHTQ